MITNTTDIDAAASDVNVASVLLHKASKKVVKLREELASQPVGTCKYVLFKLQEEITLAEEMELQAERNWEEAIARLEYEEEESFDMLAE